MVELNPNISGDTAAGGFLHRIDPRTRLLLLVAVALMVMHLRFLGLTWLTLLLIAVVPAAGIDLRTARKGLFYWFVMLILVWLSRALTTSGHPFLEIGVVSVTREGSTDGLLVCWRLTIVVLTGWVYTATSRISQTKAALQWFLKPVPWLPERRMAVMLSLLIRFVPVVVQQVRQTALAQRARAVECRKNPFYRAVKLVSPAMRRVFLTADNLTVAMEARCFSENRTDPKLAFGRADRILMAALTITGLLFLLF